MVGYSFSPFVLVGDVILISVQKAYRQMCKLFHPDRATDDILATKKFQALQKAYAVLIDKTKRKIYDAHGTIEWDEKPSVFIVSDEHLAECKQSYSGEIISPQYELE